MNALPPRYSREEAAQRGQEIYERHIRPAVETTRPGQFVAIDIETGDYEVDKDDFTATEHLLMRQPKAQIWLVRVGSPATYRIGGPRSKSRSSA